MRTLISFACLSALLAVLAVPAGAVEPDVGSLSVEGARGTIVLDVRGSVLGRLAQGTITVIDRSPNDPYVANVTGRRVTQRRVGISRMVIRGQGLRFRMLGGSYRIVIRGTGISVSAVGRGLVQIDGEPRFAGDPLGVYSFDGIDCGSEPESCDAVPDEAVRHRLGGATEEGEGRAGTGSR